MTKMALIQSNVNIIGAIGEDVIAQINAAKSALHSCGLAVLEGHLRHCVREGIEGGDADQAIDSFSLAIKRFANL